MVKARVWFMAIGLVLSGGVWHAAAGVTFGLSQLKSVCVRVGPLDPDSRSLGLSEEAVGNHASMRLKDKLPKLQVERYRGTDTGDCAHNAPRLWVQVDLVPLWDARHGYFGMLEIRLMRTAQPGSGKVGRGIGYEGNIALRGHLATAPKDVNKGLDSLLREFAAEYYKAGNP
ncbi:MAG: hypothetical protein ACE5K9_06335 [Candidatus Methylomirabilales bacterium]